MMKPAESKASLPLKTNGANENAGSIRPLGTNLFSDEERGYLSTNKPSVFLAL